MARIPTPVTQGAQRIGNVQISQNTNTPFQNLRAPDLSGPGRALQQAGEGIQRAGVQIAEISEQNQKRELIAFENEEAVLRTQLDTSLAGLEGQELIDAIQSDNGVLQQYEQGMAQLKFKYGSRVSGVYADTLERASRLGSVTFANTITGRQVEAQKAVDKQLIAGRIGRTTVTARAAAGSDAQEGVVKSSLMKIEQSVRDPDIGLAAVNGITNKEDVDLLVKEQQATVLQAVAEELLAQGKTSQASAFVKEHTQPGGILDGTAIGTTLQSALQTQTDLQAGTDAFETFWTESGGNPSQVLSNIFAIEDATLQDKAMSAFKSYMGAQAIVEREQIGDAVAALQAYAAANNGSIEGINPQTILPILKHEPQILNVFALGTRQRQVARETGEQSAFEAHVAAGGAERPSPIIESSLRQMASEDPARFVSLTPETMRPLLGYEQYQDMVALQIERRAWINQQKAAGKDTSLNAAINSLGFSSSDRVGQKVKDALLQSEEIRSDFVTFVEQTIEETGQPPTDDQFTAKIAEYALRVIDDEGYFSNEVSAYILSERARNGEPVADIPLDTGTRSVRILGFALGETAPAIKEQIEDLRAVGQPVTLNTLRAAFGKPLIGRRAADLQDGVKEQQAFEDAALGMGYNPEFMLWLVEQRGDVMSLDTLNALASAFSTPTGRAEYQQAYELWASGN